MFNIVLMQIHLNNYVMTITTIYLEGKENSLVVLAQNGSDLILS